MAEFLGRRRYKRIKLARISRIVRTARCANAFVLLLSCHFRHWQRTNMASWRTCRAYRCLRIHKVSRLIPRGTTTPLQLRNDGICIDPFEKQVFSPRFISSLQAVVGLGPKSRFFFSVFSFCPPSPLYFSTFLSVEHSLQIVFIILIEPS